MLMRETTAVDLVTIISLVTTGVVDLATTALTMRGDTATALHAITTRVRRGMSCLAEIFVMRTLTMRWDRRITTLIATITRKMICDPVEVEVSNKPLLIIRITRELCRLTINVMITETITPKICSPTITSLGIKIMITTTETIVRQIVFRDRATVHSFKTTIMMTDTTNLRGGVMAIDVVAMTTISQTLTIVMAMDRIKVHLNRTLTKSINRRNIVLLAIFNETITAKMIADTSTLFRIHSIILNTTRARLNRALQLRFPIRNLLT